MSDLYSLFILFFGKIIAVAPFAFALLAGLMLPVPIILLSTLTKKVPNFAKLLVIFGCILIGFSLSIAFSGRVLISNQDLIENPALAATINIQEGNNWPSRVAHFILLSLCITEIFNWAQGKKKLQKKPYQLWLISMIYFSLTVLASGLFGEFRNIGINYI